MYKNYVSPEEVKDMEDGVYDDSFNNLSSEEAKKAEEAAKAEEAKESNRYFTDAELKRRDNPISAWETNLRYAPQLQMHGLSLLMPLASVTSRITNMQTILLIMRTDILR